jgi:hypothetical protein
MFVKKVSWMGLSAALTVGMIACGGGPDIDQVREDFENPSGSTTDKTAVMSASSQASASGSVRSLGASGVPGQGLTAIGKVRGFGEVNMMNRYMPMMQQNYYRFFKNESAPLRTAEFEECGGAEAQAAGEEIAQELGVDVLLGGGSASASASFEMNLDNCGAGVTGTVKVEMEVELSENRLYYKITEELQNVCETEGEMACLDGTLLMEAELNANGENDASARVLVAWEVDGTWQENGAQRSASLKGGVKVEAAAMGNAGSGSVEYLVYAITPDGEEYSFVYEISADWDGVGGGSGMLSIRGRDGELSCSYTPTMVSCTGSGDLSWTAEEEIALSGEVYGG